MKTGSSGLSTPGFTGDVGRGVGVKVGEGVGEGVAVAVGASDVGIIVWQASEIKTTEIKIPNKAMYLCDIELLQYSVCVFRQYVCIYLRAFFRHRLPTKVAFYIWSSISFEASVQFGVLHEIEDIVRQVANDPWSEVKSNFPFFDRGLQSSNA
jgi:hypothetical protein